MAIQFTSDKEEEEEEEKEVTAREKQYLDTDPDTGLLKEHVHE